MGTCIISSLPEILTAIDKVKHLASMITGCVSSNSELAEWKSTMAHVSRVVESRGLFLERTIQSTVYDADSARNLIFRIALSEYVKQELMTWKSLVALDYDPNMEASQYFSYISEAHSNTTLNTLDSLKTIFGCAIAARLFEDFFSRYDDLLVGHIAAITPMNTNSTDMKLAMLIKISLEFHVGILSVVIMSASTVLPSTNGSFDGVVFRGELSEIRHNQMKKHAFLTFRDMCSALQAEDLGVRLIMLLDPNMKSEDDDTINTVVFVSPDMLERCALRPDQAVGKDYQTLLNKMLRPSHDDYWNSQEPTKNVVHKKVVRRGHILYDAIFMYNPTHMSDLHQIKSFLDFLLYEEPAAYCCRSRITDNGVMVEQTTWLQKNVSESISMQTQHNECRLQELCFVNEERVRAIINATLPSKGRVITLHSDPNIQKGIGVKSVIVLPDNSSNHNNKVLLSAHFLSTTFNDAPPPSSYSCFNWK